MVIFRGKVFGWVYINNYDYVLLMSNTCIAFKNQHRKINLKADT